MTKIVLDFFTNIWQESFRICHAVFLDFYKKPRNGVKSQNDADTGEVAEWFNAAVLKTVEDASPPRVRISASPPIVVQKALVTQGFFVVSLQTFSTLPAGRTLGEQFDHKRKADFRTPMSLANECIRKPAALRDNQHSFPSPLSTSFFSASCRFIG